jgi:hypothetical protein
MDENGSFWLGRYHHRLRHLCDDLVRLVTSFWDPHDSEEEEEEEEDRTNQTSLSPQQWNHLRDRLRDHDPSFRSI